MGGRTWCKDDGRTRVWGDSCTKSKHPNLEKGEGTWCKGDENTRAWGDSCTKSKRPNLEKGGKTWCKGDGRTRSGEDSCTKSKRPDLEKGGKTWCKGDGRTRAGTDSCTKSSMWRWRIIYRFGTSSWLRKAFLVPDVLDGRELVFTGDYLKKSRINLSSRMSPWRCTAELGGDDIIMVHIRSNVSRSMPPSGSSLVVNRLTPSVKPRVR